jgi:MYXO-CTERM domain-containing protein
MSLILSVALLAGLAAASPDAVPSSPAPATANLAGWAQQLVNWNNEHQLLDVTKGRFGRLVMQPCGDCDSLLPIVLNPDGGVTTAPPVATKFSDSATCTSTGTCSGAATCTSQEGCSSGGQCTMGTDCSTGAECTTGPDCSTGGRCTKRNGGALCSSSTGCTTGPKCPKVVPVPATPTTVPGETTTYLIPGLAPPAEDAHGFGLAFAGLLGLGLPLLRRRRRALLMEK